MMMMMVRKRVANNGMGSEIKQSSDCFHMDIILLFIHSVFEIQTNNNNNSNNNKSFVRSFTYMYVLYCIDGVLLNIQR